MAALVPATWPVRDATAGRVVIVGAGIAGLSAAEGLRAAGYDGEVVLLGDEPVPPYHRPALSSELLVGAAGVGQVVVAGPDRLAARRLELVTGCRVTRLDPAARTVSAADGRTWPYDDCVVATGTRPLRLPGRSREALSVGSIADAERVRPLLTPGRRVLVVGAGLLGGELAASAHRLGCEVTLVEAAEGPLARTLPRQLLPAVTALHAAHGVVVHSNVRVVSVDDVGETTSVAAADGRSLSAEVVLVAVGTEPATLPARDAGARVDDGVLVDALGRTPVPGLWAAGDVARRPEPILGGTGRSGHWASARDHGAAVGRAVAGEGEGFAEVPAVATRLYGTAVHAAGWPAAADRVVVRGEPSARDAVAWCLRGDRLVGVAALGRPGEVRSARALIGIRQRVDVAALAGSSRPLADCLAP